MLGLLGLRIFEATGADITDLRRETRPPRAAGRRQGHQDRPRPLPPAVARADRPSRRRATDGPILLDTPRRPDGPARRHPPPAPLAEAAGVRLPRMHPHMLRHTYVTTMLDAGVDLRDVQIAARHADPRTTMRYDRARKNLDRHPNYILAAYMASGT